MLDSIWTGSGMTPGLQQIGRAFFELASNGVLARYSVASLFRVTAGFYSAVLTAVPLGVLLGRTRAANRWFNPVIQFLRPISPLAWIPFAMLWLGMGDLPAIFIIFLAAFFPILISTANSSANINPIYYQVGSNLQFSFWTSLCHVTLPAIMPDIVISLRVALGVSWMVVVAAEMIAVKSGLGYLIIDARNALRMDLVVVAMISIGAIGLLLDRVMVRFARSESMRWKVERA